MCLFKSRKEEQKLTQSPMNLHQKLIEIRKNIGSIEKDKKGFNYDYVSGSQILSKVIGTMNDLGVLLIPKVLSQSHEMHTVQMKNKVATVFVVSGEMTYTWLNAEEPTQTLEVPFYYTGSQDEVSKAYGSALTYAERYFLIKFFNLPVENNNYGGYGSNQQPTYNQQQNYRNGPATNASITPEQKRKLRLAIEAASTRMNVDGSVVFSFAKTQLNIAENITTKQLNNEQANIVIAFISKMQNIS